MDEKSYRFQLGDLQCTAVLDGTKDYPLKNFFANVPLAQAEGALRQRGQPIDHITTPYTYLYVDTGEHRALVDMGAGSLAPTTLTPTTSAARSTRRASLFTPTPTITSGKGIGHSGSLRPRLPRCTRSLSRAHAKSSVLCVTGSISSSARAT